MTNLKKILRTCIFCRSKTEQKELIRLRCENKKLVLYNNYGRSFYICKDCSLKIQANLKTKDFKRLEKILNKECKSSDDFVTQVKEILINVR